MIAASVATPVVDFLGDLPVEGTVLGSSRAAVYIDCGFVVAVTARTVPAMPNGVTLAAEAVESPPPAGTPARLGGARIEAGGWSVELAGATRWSPEAPRASAACADVGRRGRGLFRNQGIAPAADPAALARSLLASSGLAAIADHGARKGLRALLEALRQRDPDRGAEAAELLLGRGGGLTPEGDDLVAAAVAAVLAFGAACGFAGMDRALFVDALVPGDLRKRTNALAATLVELAATGRVVEPVRHICDLSLPPDAWRPHLRRLVALGHSTGRAWAVGIAASASLLAAEGPH